MSGVYTQDPSSRLDRYFDWSEWLGSDTITSYTVTCDGLTISGVTELGGVITYWVEGGEHRKDYTVFCNIITAAGRKDERSVIIMVRNSETRIDR